jgi:hypothetical protein
VIALLSFVIVVLGARGMCIYFVVALSLKMYYISRKMTSFARAVILRYLVVLQLSQSVVVEVLQERGKPHHLN